MKMNKEVRGADGKDDPLSNLGLGSRGPPAQNPQERGVGSSRFHFNRQFPAGHSYWSEREQFWRGGTDTR